MISSTKCFRLSQFFRTQTSKETEKNSKNRESEIRNFLMTHTLYYDDDDQRLKRLNNIQLQSNKFCFMTRD